MTCTGCGFETPPDFTFCPKCGRRLPGSCPSCGFACAPDFVFCPRCGAPLGSGPSVEAPAGDPAAASAPALPPAVLPAPAAAPTAPAVAPTKPRSLGGLPAKPPDLSGEADRRQVTVLFADLSGFTALAERLDPEEVRAFQNALFETMAEAIGHYDGFVEKFVGDAVMAVFGAPIAHEDDPERAVHAGLAILGSSETLSCRWAPQLGGPVALHAAIHTGQVVAGSLGAAASAAYAVTGDTVNTTSRLLSEAAPGTLLVSQATYELTRHRFAFEPGGDVALRGKSEAIRVYRAVGVLAEPGSARGLMGLGLTAPLVGRADELEQLLAAFGRVRGGRAQVVSLVGDAGAGKSRLVTEFMARLESEGWLAGATVRRATCSSLGEQTYGVFGALFREAYRVDPADTLDVARQKLAAGLRALGAADEDTAAIAPVLGYVLGLEAGEDLRNVEPEQLQRQIVLAARTLVERRLQQGPLLILVDDLHWADAASVDLLRHVVDHLLDRPLMILLSHRPETPPPLIARAAQAVIRLAPLVEGETRTLVSALFGEFAGEFRPNLEEFVVTRAGGNPFFVEELIRTLVGTGVLVRRDGRWECTAPCDTVQVPPTLHGLLLSRVDRLSADARRLLQEAAVLGSVFDEDLLRAIATDPAACGAALDRLLEADLIREVALPPEPVRYRFSHALVHDAVYQNLLLARRTELHDRVGGHLERILGARERLQDLEALGHHFSLSHDKPKGARYLLEAGDWARAVYANDDAIRHYARALGTLTDCHGCESERHAARERLGDLLGLSGRRPEALEHYEAVHEALARGGERARAARLQRKIGGLYWDAGDRERAQACFASGLELLGEDGDPVERGHLYQEMGRLAFRAGDNRGAVTWAEQALAEADRHVDGQAASDRNREIAVVRAHAYNTRGVALARMGHPAEAVGQIERSIELAEAHDLLQAACRGYTNLGVLYSSLDPRRSIETCLRGLAMAKRVGDLGFQSRLYANLAVAYCALTDQCEAEGIDAAKAAIDLDRRLGLLDHLAVPLIVLGQIYQCHGARSPAFACYEEALGVAERVGEPQLLFPCYDGLATLHLDAGNSLLAQAYLVKAQQVCEQAGLDPDALMVLPFLC